MQAHAASFLKMWLKAAVELILAFPLVFLLHYWVISINMPTWIALLIGFYSLGYLASAWLHLNKWYSLLFIGLCCSGIVTYGAFGLSLSGIVTGIFGFYLFFRGTFIAKRAWLTVFQIQYYWLGLAIYFVVAVFFKLKPDMNEYLPLLFWFGLISVAVTLLVSSQERIIQESLPERDGRHLVNNKQLWHSRFLSIAILLIITLAAGLRQIADGLSWLNHMFWKFVLYVAQKLSELFTSKPVEETPPTVEPQPPMVLPPAKEPSTVIVWLEKIVYVVFIVVICAVLLFLLYLLGKWLIRFSKRLYNWLTGRLDQNEGNQAAGFEDESTRLTTMGDLIKSYSTKVIDWLEQLRKREVKWSDLTTNAERVRYLYRLFVTKSLSKGNKVDLHLTAQEMISTIQHRLPELSHDSEKLASLYNQARYSDHPVGDEDIKRLSKDLKPD
jgi:hypothetical protein